MNAYEALAACQPSHLSGDTGWFMLTAAIAAIFVWEWLKRRLRG